MNKGPKTITFTYGGKEYTLEFCRKTVRLLENRGFNLNEIDSKPITMLPMLFWGAFQMHHKGTTQETTDDILEHISKRDSLFGKLTEMYLEPVNNMVDNEAEEGNVSWDPSW